jgi:hypothetical protein
MWKSLRIIWRKENKIGVKPIVSVHVLERLSQIARAPNLAVRVSRIWTRFLLKLFDQFFMATGGIQTGGIHKS